MKLDHRILIRSMLRTHGTVTVRKTLASSGIFYTDAEIDLIRKNMERKGQREPVQRSQATLDDPLYAPLDHAAAYEGSRKLLEAQLACGQYFPAAREAYLARVELGEA